MDIITAKNLELYYGSFQALKGIDMNIPEKEITAFIGPSGCGKSTFLRCLNRMNDLVTGCKITGEVKFKNNDIYDKFGNKVCSATTYDDGVSGMKKTYVTDRLGNTVAESTTKINTTGRY